MTLFTLILTLLGCPTAPEEIAGDCPTTGYVSDADLPCDCAGELVDALPGCGEAECTDEGMIYLDIGCDTGSECGKGVDCG